MKQFISLIMCSVIRDGKPIKIEQRDEIETPQEAEEILHRLIDVATSVGQKLIGISVLVVPNKPKEQAK